MVVVREGRCERALACREKSVRGPSRRVLPQATTTHEPRTIGRHERGLPSFVKKGFVRDRTQQEIAPSHRTPDLVLLLDRQAEPLVKQVCELVRASSCRLDAHLARLPIAPSAAVQPFCLDEVEAVLDAGGLELDKVHAPAARFRGRGRRQGGGGASRCASTSTSSAVGGRGGGQWG